MRSNPAARRRLQNAVIDGEWLGTGPIAYGRIRPISGVISIGDAGAFIDPFTGSGILLALSSGELVADTISQAIAAGASDAEAISKSYDRVHRAKFGWRFRACAILRAAAFSPTARNARAHGDDLPASTRTRLIAQSTRHQNYIEGRSG